MPKPNLSILSFFFRQTGLVSITDSNLPSSQIIEGLAASRARFNIFHETLSGPDLCQRYKGIRYDDGYKATFYTQAGVLKAAKALHCYQVMMLECEIFVEFIEKWVLKMWCDQAKSF